MDIATRICTGVAPPGPQPTFCNTINAHTESPWSRSYHQLYELAVFVSNLHGPAMATYAPTDALQIQAWAETAARVE